VVTKESSKLTKPSVIAIATCVALFAFAALAYFGAEAALNLSGARCTHFSGGINVRFGENCKLTRFHIWQMSLLRDNVYLDLTRACVNDEDIMRLVLNQAKSVA
jgi:hypothetical protein